MSSRQVSGGKILERRAPLDAGVVDEHVNRTDLLFDPGHSALDALRIGHVEYGRVRHEPFALHRSNRGRDFA